MYDLGTEIEITYFVKEKGLSMSLKEGDNTSPELSNEVINLERMKSCYKVTSKIDRPEVQLKRDNRAVRMHFSPDIEVDSLPRKVRFYFTSEENAYGIESGIFPEGVPYETVTKRNLRNPWHLGRPVQQIINIFIMFYICSSIDHLLIHEYNVLYLLELNYYSHAKIKPRMSLRLQEKSGCEDVSYWKKVESVFVPSVKEKCGHPCFSRSLPDGTLDMCETYSDWECADQVFNDTLNGLSYLRYVPCAKLEYEGRIDDYEHTSWMETGKVKHQ